MTTEQYMNFEQFSAEKPALKKDIRLVARPLNMKAELLAIQVQMVNIG